MEKDEYDKTGVVGTSDDIDSRCAVNSLILDYYKKFGRKRDLEQYFSLSTAQSDIKDTSGLFWRKMKSENDSSDSGGRKTDSPHEVCRISIRCSLPEASSSQDDEPKTKSGSPSPQTVSPPIIVEEVPADVSRQTDDDSINLDDNNSQKSLDALLDLSMNKPLSPTSSITSQRKLEWDSLADVGYANESDRKNSASSLSTLERLALKQQYSNNDSKQDIGPPTSQSTPIEENEGKYKGKKGIGKKTMKIYKKDVDFVEVNMPHTSDTNQAPSINVNLTKHISFNVEKDGGITVDNIKRDINISPEKVSVETEPLPYLAMDKEIQTSLTKEMASSKEKSSSMDETLKTVKTCNQKIPVMISLNTLRRRLRKRKTRVVKKKSRTKKKLEKKEVTPQERSGEQLSEAESFEYMPGHMYNQNQLKDIEPRPDNSNGNKSSLESSGPLTTDSSKDSKHSLTKDLEKCVDVLKLHLQNRYDDGNTKKRLIKQIVNRLINSKYRDDESTTEFLSGLSYNSKKLGIKGNNTTTSTSDANNTDDSKQKRPKKSILRDDKFNSIAVASTSQSAPNLFAASSEKVNTSLIKTIATNTESDASSKGKASSENGFPKTSSEELYLKYLEALRREEAYKKHLREKELFLKQKLTSSETALKAPIRQESKVNSRLKDLMKDLTRNNYDDGSGDASKLEGASSTNIDLEGFQPRNHRSHSVFTLSSSLSEGLKRANLKKKMQAEREDEAGTSKNHYCCCPHHYMNSKVGYADSSVQVNIKYQCEDTSNNEKPRQTKPKALMPCNCKKPKPESPRKTHVVPDDVTGEIKYVCLCKEKQVSTSDMGDNFMIYKCSRLTNRGVQISSENPLRAYNTGIQCEDMVTKDDRIELIQPPCTMNTVTVSSSSDHSSKARRCSKSSQTDMRGTRQGNENYYCGSEVKNICGTSTRCIVVASNCITIQEATRCLQTEISINPTISDPTLSDIVIVNDCDCATLIAEQIRRVSVNSSEKSGTKTYSDVSTNSDSGKLLIRSEDNLFREEIQTCKTSSNDMRKEKVGHSTVTIANTYTRPFEDLTLRTRMGSIEQAKKTEQVTQCVGTEKIGMADEATAISEECGISGPCSYANSLECTINKSSPKTSFANSVERATNKSSPKIGPTSIKSRSSPRKILRDGPKCNTNPKKEPVKEKPPFKRTNTDTGALSICTCVQTEKIDLKDIETNNTSIVICEPLVQIVPCETGVQIQKSVDECTLRQQRPTQTETNCDKRNMGTQKDLSDEETKTCTEGKPKKIFIETPEIVTRNVGCETDTEASNKKDIRSGPDRQDYARELKEVIVNEPKICPSDCVLKDSAECSPTESCCIRGPCSAIPSNDPIIGMIRDITHRFSKKEIVRIKKKKCFTEIMTVLNYLLETEDSTEPDQKMSCSTSGETKPLLNNIKCHKRSKEDCCVTKQGDKSDPLPACRSTRKCSKDESSDLPCSSDLPTTSTDSAACKVFNKIKKECEKYHLRKCKGRKCEVSSSSSVNCEKCQKIHHCACRNHKCKRSKAFEKLKKKCIAYNLIIQTSESVLSEETVCEKKCRPLQNIILKVPKRKDKKEAARQQQSSNNPHGGKNRSKSCPNESETSDEFNRRVEMATVREYLEQNRPDFVENTAQRQSCLKFISERRASERSVQRGLLSLHVEKQPDLTKLSSDELLQLAKEIGINLRRSKPLPKLISEREMKKHSENIYKTLPEVVQKKEEKKKENIKKTNLLMANLFKKNLQQHTLRGSVNLSNYNTVIKI